MKLEKLHFYKQEYYKLLDFLPVAVAVARKAGAIDDQGLPIVQLHYLNQKFEQVLGYSLQDIPDSIVWDQIVFPDQNYRQQVQNKLKEALNQNAYQFRDVIKVKCKNGDYNWFEIIVENFNASESDFFYYVFIEINAFQEQINKLEDIAHLDPLTRLLNRRGMLEAINHQVFSTSAINQNLCLALVDIDHFKQINDRLGHLGGDYALQQFSQHLQENIRHSDLLSRWGGEEFLIIFPNTDISTARSILQRIQNSLQMKEIIWQDKMIHITFTCGISQSINKINLTQLIEQADQAMYQGKETGRNRIVSSL